MFGIVTKEEQRITELEKRVERIADLERRVEFLSELVGQLNEALGGALSRLNDLEAQKVERPRSHFSKGEPARPAKRSNEKVAATGSGEPENNDNRGAQGARGAVVSEQQPARSDAGNTDAP